MRVEEAERQVNGNNKAAENATRNNAVADAGEDIVGGTDSRVSRPEHEVFGMAMLGGGKIFGAAHAYGTRPVSRPLH
jgi:hypothetical protein